MQFHLITLPSTWCSLNVTELSVLYILHHVVQFNNSTVQLMLSNSYITFSPIYILSCSYLYVLYRLLDAPQELQKLRSDIYFTMQFHLRTLISTWCSLTVTETSVRIYCTMKFHLRILTSNWCPLTFTETSFRYIFYHSVPFKNCTVH